MAFAFDRIGDEHLLGRDLAAAPSHKTLDGINCLSRLEGTGACRLISHNGCAFRVREIDHRRSDALSLFIRDDQRDAAVHGRGQ